VNFLRLDANKSIPIGLKAGRLRAEAARFSFGDMIAHYENGNIILYLG
jgi:hypothetical protein